MDADWKGFLSVRRLLALRGLTVAEYASPSFVGHTLWGGLFAKALGLSHNVLRLSTLTLALIALGLSETPWALLANPLFFLLSFTFMTDVPFLAWSLLCYALYRRALATDRTGWWLAGGVAGCLAFAVRQTGLCLPAGMTLFLLWNRKLGGRRAALIFLPPVLAVAAHSLWFHRAAGAAWVSRSYDIAGVLDHLSHPKAAAWDVYARAAASILYLSLFTLPQAFAIWTAQGFKTPSAKRLLACLAFLVPLLLKINAFPFFAGVVSESGLGNPTISGILFKNTGPVGTVWFMAALTLAAVLGYVTWAAHFPALVEATRDEEVLFLAVPCLLQWAMSLAAPKYWDRYLLPVLPWALLAATRTARTLGAKSAALGLVLMLSWSFLGTWDYLNWNSAKWEAGRRAQERGYPPDKVMNGVEWCGVNLYEEKMERLLKEKPLEKIGEWEWVRTEPFYAIASFSPYSEFDRLLEVPYWTPLSTAPGVVYAFKARDAVPGSSGARGRSAPSLIRSGSPKDRPLPKKPAPRSP